MPIAAHTKKINELGGSHNMQNGWRFADHLPSEKRKNEFVVWAQANGYEIADVFRDRTFGLDKWSVKFREKI